MANELVPDGHSGSNHFIAVGGYRKNSTAHRLVVELHSDDDRQDLVLFYECPAVQGESLHSPPRSILRTTRQLEWLFSSEQFTEISSEFHCDVRFHYTSSEVSTLVTLPMMTMANPTLPFSAVTGIRFEKHVGDDSVYSVLMTRSQRRNALICQVQFHAEHSVGTEFPRNYLSDAMTIARKFVFLKGSSDATS